jgi:predicted dehydrogenase
MKTHIIIRASVSIYILKCRNENLMRIAIIGSAGHYGYIFPAVSLYGSEFAGVYLPSRYDNPAALFSALDHHDIKYKLYDNYDSMIRETKPDIAVINTVFSENGKIAADALSKGIHVFCEKPLAADYETLALLEDAYRSANRTKRVHLAGMFGLRYNAAMRTVKNSVDNGIAGNITLINVQKSYKMGNRPGFYSTRQTYGGIIPWVAIHGIDWIYWITGRRFTSVSAAHTRISNGGNGDMESSSLCCFTLDGGIIASVSADMLRPLKAATHGDDRIRIVGDAGIIEAVDDRVFFTGTDTVRRELELCEEGDIFGDFIKTASENRPASLDAASSLYVTKTALAAREAADTGKVICL